MAQNWKLKDTNLLTLIGCAKSRCDLKASNWHLTFCHATRKTDARQFILGCALPICRIRSTPECNIIHSHLSSNPPPPSHTTRSDQKKERDIRPRNKTKIKRKKEASPCKIWYIICYTVCHLARALSRMLPRLDREGCVRSPDSAPLPFPTMVPQFTWILLPPSLIESRYNPLSLRNRHSIRFAQS